ncbi:hypothetical protein J6590_096175 [Homalodisca vitripennis]|nr:hypothetical protein J6590_096175 [Homalodisca vitripennis]
MLQDHLTPNMERETCVQKARTVTTNRNSLTKSDGSSQVTMKGWKGHAAGSFDTKPGKRDMCQKARTVTTNRNSLTKSDGSSQVTMKVQDSTLTVNEIEKMFGFPEHYTDVMNFNASIRQKLLGKAWSSAGTTNSTLQDAVKAGKDKLQDHLTPNLERETCVQKARTVTTNRNSLTKSDGSSQVTMKGQDSTLTVNEIEKMFGFPEHYTDVMNFNASIRQKLLGKAWSSAGTTNSTLQGAGKDMLQDHLTPNLERETCIQKARTVTTNRNSLTKSDGSSQVTMKGQDSTLTVNEIEKMFGFPEHYTDVMNFNASIRQKLLGKAWSYAGTTNSTLQVFLEWLRCRIGWKGHAAGSFDTKPGKRDMCRKDHTVTTNRKSLTKSDGSSQVTMKVQDSTLTVNEIEKMFGFPEHYTDVMNFNASIRQKLLGKLNASC